MRKMKDRIVVKKDGVEGEENLLPSVSKSIDFPEESSILSKDILHDKVLNPIVVLFNGSSCNKQWLIQNMYGMDNNIPKQIIGLDEKYLRRCLEWIHVRAFGVTSHDFSSNLEISRNYFGYSGFSTRSTNNMGIPAIECPFPPAGSSVAVSSMGDHILGRISASKSMINILSSPLFHQFGVSETTEINQAISAGFISSPGYTVANKPGKLKEAVLGDHEYRYGSKPTHKRLASASSTNSTCSDQSSSSASTVVSQGMLQCTWKDGYPHYLFSVDDLGEVYVASLFKHQSPDDKALDYVYSFHSKSGRRREHENREMDLVAKMKVSTSVTLCSKNSEITETQFVLFGSSESWTHEQNSVPTIKKNKRLAKKVSDVFKQRRSSKNLGTSTILEDTSWESSDDVVCKSLDYASANVLDVDTPPNLELAAIVVKDHVCGKPKEPQAGGWGMKFLKKSGIPQSDTTSRNSSVTECCQQDNSSECSTSMNIILPAGYHGGPRTRNGGPSTLLQRWHSGGRCDCGGWDLGCPLTVMNTRTNRMDHPPSPDSGECRTVELFVEGSRQNTPVMKMTNIHEDLYYIHFQSTLSALQSFCIAAAIIHSHSPSLRPKLYSG